MEGKVASRRNSVFERIKKAAYAVFLFDLLFARSKLGTELLFKGDNMPCPSNAELGMLASGQVNGPPRKEIEDHLAVCVDCTRKFEDIRKVDAMAEEIQNNTPGTIHQLASEVAKDREDNGEPEPCPQTPMLFKLWDEGLTGEAREKTLEHVNNCDECRDNWKLFSSLSAMGAPLRKRRKIKKILKFLFLGLLLVAGILMMGYLW